MQIVADVDATGTFSWEAIIAGTDAVVQAAHSAWQGPSEEALYSAGHVRRHPDFFSSLSL